MSLSRGARLIDATVPSPWQQRVAPDSTLALNALSDRRYDRLLWQDHWVPRRQKLIFAAFVIAGLGFFVVAGIIGGTGTTDDISVSDNPAIDGLIPGRGDEVLQQQTVGVDLAAEYRLLTLTISPDARCSSPVDVTEFTRHVEGLQQYLFTPAIGTPIEALSGEFNCARAVFEKISRPGEFQEIDWTFSVN